MARKKYLGQNFLVDRGVVADMIKAAEVNGDDVILEIGAGEGALTKELAKKAGKVIAVEIDKDLIPALKENLEDYPNAEIINEDILKFPISNFKFQISKIVGSIPYSITSPLIHKLLAIRQKPKTIVFLVQKEVAEKIAAKPPQASYLSNLVAPFYDVKTIRIVPPSAFRPQPKVDSTILKLTLKPKPHPLNPKPYTLILRHGFTQPRKMIKHRFPLEVLTNAGIEHTRRAQTLTHQEWMKLYDLHAQTHKRAKSRKGGGVWRTEAS